MLTGYITGWAKLRYLRMTSSQTSYLSNKNVSSQNNGDEELLSYDPKSTASQRISIFKKISHDQFPDFQENILQFRIFPVSHVPSKL